MEKYILIILSMISVFYGIMVFMAGSGSKFWLIWEMLGVFFFLCGILCYRGYFHTHKKIGILLGVLVAAGIFVLIILCSLVGKEFYAKGEQNLEYMIVLGAQVKEDGPSKVLQYRLDTAITYLNENPDTVCIVSGGKGTNEVVSEAEGMYQYLIEHGIEKERIRLEDKSTNTKENIQYSKELMGEAYENVGIVTNNFHVYRAVQLAKTQGLKNVCGIAAKSTVCYLPNNVLRECLGIVKEWICGNVS